jgi:5-methylcytosine-specific restriction endonuclease McrA
VVVRLVRPQYKKEQIANLNGSCRVCKAIFRKPGVDNQYCCQKHKEAHIAFLHKRILKRQRKSERKVRISARKERTRNNFVTIKIEDKDVKLSLFQALSEKKFYQSREWMELRFKVLVKFGRKCICCFRTNVELHVDHIKPLSKFPDSALDENNLQVLCRECNLGKSNKFETDFRS